MYPRQVLSLLLLLLCGDVLLAQDYRPFLPGRLHYFVSGTNFSVRIDSTGVIGSDSAYWMNRVGRNPSVDCAYDNHTHFVPEQEGLYGDHWIHRSDGAFQCVSLTGDTATFHTQLPVGTNWQFLSDSNITAHIALRGLVPVGGNLDSMVVIDLSDGSQYRLTQHHGIYLGPNPSYFFGLDSLRFATLAGPPEVPDFKQYWAWDIGDNFTIQDLYSGNWEKYDRYEILSRNVSFGGDSLWFTVKHGHSEQWSGLPVAVLPPDTMELNFGKVAYGFLELATDEPYYHAQGYHRQRSWEYDPEYSNRRSLKLDYFDDPGILDSCGYSHPNLAFWCVDPMPKQMALGLGETYREKDIGHTNTTCMYSRHTLVCYDQLGYDSLTPCPPIAALLGQPQPNVDAASVSVSARQGRLTVSWDGFRPGVYRWQCLDLQGRLLWVDVQAMQPSGEAGVPFGPHAGLYLLRISDETESWVRTVRIPMLN